MNKFMLVGPVSCGKSTLCQALNNLAAEYKKTQAIEVVGGVIDTPGEYLECRKLYRALIVTAVQADRIVLLQSCTDGRMLFPHGFSSMFFGKEVLGVVSKTDAAADPSRIETAHKRLQLAGASRVFQVSSLTGQGLEELREYLMK